MWLPISESDTAQHKTSTAAEGKSLKDFATCCYDAEERGGKLSKILGVRKHELGASFGKGRPPPAVGVTPSENFGLKSCTLVHFRHQNVLFTMTSVFQYCKINILTGHGILWVSLDLTSNNAESAEPSDPMALLFDSELQFFPSHYLPSRTVVLAIVFTV